MSPTPAAPKIFKCVICNITVYRPGYRSEAPPGAVSYGGRDVCFRHKGKSPAYIKEHPKAMDKRLKTPRTLSKTERAAALACAQFVSGEELEEALRMLGLHPSWEQKARHMGSIDLLTPHIPSRDA